MEVKNQIMATMKEKKGLTYDIILIVHLLMVHLQIWCTPSAKDTVTMN